MICGVAYGMTPEEFMEQYPNDFIYRIHYPDGRVNYFSSPVELKFSLIDESNGEKSNFGKALHIENPSPGRTFYQLTSSGKVNSYSRASTAIWHDPANLIGFEGNIDIFQWNGYGFFLPVPSTFLRDLVGQTQTILLIGFGILSVMLLIRLLRVYFRRWLLRSI